MFFKKRQGNSRIVCNQHQYSLMNPCVICNGCIWHSSSHGQENEIAANINRNITVIHNYIIEELSNFYIIYLFVTHSLMLSPSYFVFIYNGNVADARMGIASLPGPWARVAL